MIFFIASSTVALTCWVFAGFTGNVLWDARGALVLWGVSTAAYFACVLSLSKVKNERRAGAAVVAFSALMLAAAWFVSPNLTTDYYRYMWDARVGAAGMSPYENYPEAAALKELRDDVAYRQMAFKGVPTVYGPGAQALFRGFYAVFKTDARGWKAGFFAFHLLNMFMILKLLDAAGVSRKWLAVYAYNPLVLLDLCVNMHYDAAVIAVTLVAAVAAARNKTLWAFGALGVAALMKFFAAAFLPVFIAREIRRGGWLRAAAGAGAFFAVCAAGYALYMKPGVDMFAGVRYFAQKLDMSAHSPYYLAQMKLDRHAVDLICAGIMAAAAVAVALLKSDSERGRAALLFFIPAAIVLLSPVQRPWYFAWALPFCCVRPRASWLLLCCSSTLTYAILFDRGSVFAVKLVIYGTFYAAALLEFSVYAGTWLRKRRRRHA